MYLDTVNDSLNCSQFVLTLSFLLRLLTLHVLRGRREVEMCSCHVFSHILTSMVKSYEFLFHFRYEGLLFHSLLQADFLVRYVGYQ